MKKIKIAIVDDETLIVSLLSTFFAAQEDIEVCFTADSGEDCVVQLENSKQQPDVLILDLKMKEMTGVDVLQFLKEKYPDIKTIVMSSHYRSSFIGFVLKTGAAAFIPKGVSPQNLLEIVHELFHKGFYFDKEQMNVIREQVSSRVPQPSLTTDDILSEREVEVLKLICHQKTAQEIGDILFINKRTVEGHKKNLFLKTETKNIAGLVIYAIQNNYVKVEDIQLFV